MKNETFARYCEENPAFGEAFSLTRSGLYLKGSCSWFGGRCVYNGGRRLVDEIIAAPGRTWEGRTRF
jgi:hypothetical protein